MTYFAPTVHMPDGRVITPPGWMWIMGFAFAGSKWAIEEASTPEFRERVRAAIAAQRRAETEAEIAALERRIQTMRNSLTAGEKS